VIGQIAQSMAQAYVVTQLTQRAEGDVQEVQVFVQAFPRATLDDVGWHRNRRAAHLCEVKPKVSSFGNACVTSYTTMTSASARSNALSFLWSLMMADSICKGLPSQASPLMPYPSSLSWGYALTHLQTSRIVSGLHRGGMTPADVTTIPLW